MWDDKYSYVLISHIRSKIWRGKAT
jgi:hypothetical protein